MPEKNTDNKIIRKKMNISAIKTCVIEDGTGVRTALFVSGCTHRCKGCFQPQIWDFNNGTPFDEETEQQIINETALPYIEGLTLLGGEPMEPENQKDLLPFLTRFKQELPEKNIWCYTGYTLETDLLGKNGKARCPSTDRMLELIDILVDGEFIEEKKNISLRFRGSENQRIIDLRETMRTGNTILLDFDRR